MCQRSLVNASVVGDIGSHLFSGQRLNSGKSHMPVSSQHIIQKRCEGPKMRKPNNEQLGSTRNTGFAGGPGVSEEGFICIRSYTLFYPIWKQKNLTWKVHLRSSRTLSIAKYPCATSHSTLFVFRDFLLKWVLLAGFGACADTTFSVAFPAWKNCCPNLFVMCRF